MDKAASIFRLIDRYDVPYLAVIILHLRLLSDGFSHDLVVVKALRLLLESVRLLLNVWLLLILDVLVGLLFGLQSVHLLASVWGRSANKIIQF